MQERGNPQKKVTITEAEYVRGRRDRERLLQIRQAIKPVNKILGNITQTRKIKVVPILKEKEKGKS